MRVVGGEKERSLVLVIHNRCIGVGTGRLASQALVVLCCNKGMRFLTSPVGSGLNALLPSMGGDCSHQHHSSRDPGEARESTRQKAEDEESAAAVGRKQCPGPPEAVRGDLIALQSAALDGSLVLFRSPDVLILLMLAAELGRVIAVVVAVLLLHEPSEQMSDQSVVMLLLVVVLGLVVSAARHIWHDDGVGDVADRAFVLFPALLQALHAVDRPIQLPCQRGRLVQIELNFVRGHAGWRPDQDLHKRVLLLLLQKAKVVGDVRPDDDGDIVDAELVQSLRGNCIADCQLEFEHDGVVFDQTIVAKILDGKVERYGVFTDRRARDVVLHVWHSRGLLVGDVADAAQRVESEVCAAEISGASVLAIDNGVHSHRSCSRHVEPHVRRVHLEARKLLQLDLQEKQTLLVGSAACRSRDESETGGRSIGERVLQVTDATSEPVGPGCAAPGLSASGLACSDCDLLSGALPWHVQGFVSDILAGAL
mmetsp:Transcript_20535/g.43806  ORF Transcript_20535/g.43806 Transcript_20535/m.43806 type:complete len:481 (-) Transcript_20535:1400-2842(-)